MGGHVHEIMVTNSRSDLFVYEARREMILYAFQLERTANMIFLQMSWVLFLSVVANSFPAWLGL